MTGPQHFREAESLIRAANKIMDGFPGEAYAQTIAAAQVHATLALAAATALIDEKPRSGSFDAWREWQDACGPATSEYSKAGTS